NETPSRVLTMPVTTSSGTGLAGIETRFMAGGKAGGSGGRRIRLEHEAPLLSPAVADGADRPPSPLARKSLFANCLWPLAGPEIDPHMRFAQANRAAQREPVRPAGGPSAFRSTQRGYAMRTFDLAPLYRSTVGFDRLFSMLDGFEAAPGYPPYN